jgi:hypothetical protein
MVLVYWLAPLVASAGMGVAEGRLERWRIRREKYE